MHIEKHNITLPRTLILASEIFMVFLWGVIAFWGIVFISKGLLDINKLFLVDRVYGFVFIVIGLSFLKHVFSNVIQVRTEGLRDIVQNFLNKRFVEIIATTIFMLMTSIIASSAMQFYGTTLLLLPMLVGTTFGVSFGYFLTHTLGLPFAPFFIIASSWILELFWMYLFAKVVVKIITLFRLRSEID